MIRGRRRYPRLQIPLEAEYLVEGTDDWRQGTIQTLGAGGASLLCEEDLPVQTRLDRLRFVVQAEGDLPETRIEVGAQVIHSDRHPGVGRDVNYLLGLQFSELEEQAFELLRQFVFRRLTSGEPASSPDDDPRQRITSDTPIAIRFKRFTDFVEEVSENLSPSGMFIRATKPLPPGSQLTFQFQLGEEFSIFQGTAEVVWTRRRSEGPDRPAGMGVRFLKLDLTSQKVVSRLLEHRAEAAGAPTAAPAASSAEPEPVEVDAGETAGDAEAREAKLQQLVEQLQGRLSEAEEARDTLQGRFEELFDETESLREEVGKLEASSGEADALKAAQAELESELEQVKEESARLQEESRAREAELVAELEKTRQAEAEARESTSGEAAALLAAQTELKGLQQVQEESDRLQQDWQATESDLRAQLEKAVSAEAELRRELEESQATCEDLGQRLDRSARTEAELKAELDQFGEKSKERQDEWQARESELRSELERQGAGESELRKQLEKASGAQAELEAELERVREQSKELQAEWEANESELRGELERKSEDAAELQERLDRAAGAESELQQRLEEVEGTRTELEQRLEQSAGAEAEFRQRVDELERSLESSEADREILSEWIEKTSGEQEKLRRQVEVLRTSRGHLQESLRRVGDGVLQFRRDAEALEAELRRELREAPGAEAERADVPHEAATALPGADEVDGLDAAAVKLRADLERILEASPTVDAGASLDGEEMAETRPAPGVAGEAEDEAELPTPPASDIEEALGRARAVIQARREAAKASGEIEPPAPEPTDEPDSEATTGIVGAARRAFARLSFRKRPAGEGVGHELDSGQSPATEAEHDPAAERE